MPITTAPTTDYGIVINPSTLAPMTQGTPWQPFFLGTAGLSGLQLVKPGPGLLGGWALTNFLAGTAFVDFYDAANIGGITLGSTKPVFELAIGQNATAANGISWNAELTMGIQFRNGILVIAATASGGATAVGTAVNGSLLYR